MSPQLCPGVKGLARITTMLADEALLCLLDISCRLDSVVQKKQFVCVFRMWTIPQCAMQIGHASVCEGVSNLVSRCTVTEPLQDSDSAIRGQ